MHILEPCFTQELIQHLLGDLDLSGSYGFSFTHRHREVQISDLLYLDPECRSLVYLDERAVLNCLRVYPDLLDRSRSSSGFLKYYDDFIREQAV